MSKRQVVRIGRQDLVATGTGVLERIAQEDAAHLAAQRAQLAPLPPKALRSSTTEAAWQKEVTQLAVVLGYYVYHPKLSRWSERGWPDLSLLGARALWLELKSDTGQLTAQQVAVILRMQRCGLEVHVLRPAHTLDYVAAILQARGVADLPTPAVPWAAHTSEEDR